MKHKLVMPDDDPRSARVVWSEQKGDMMELCIAVDHDKFQWELIENAPKDVALILWIDGPEGWAPGPWRGAWSWTANQWAVHLPFMVDGKVAVATELPQPTHWAPLPAMPSNASHERPARGDGSE